MEPVRVLQVVTHMNRGGLESMLMNYYREIDRSRVQFDFLTHRSEAKAFDAEILSLGGKIYRLPPLNPFSPAYRKALKEFFETHKEYKVVHCHLDCMSSVVLAQAKKSGVPVRIAHAHTTRPENGLLIIVKSFYKCRIPVYATKLEACSRAAGRFMFGSHQFSILPNAIDTRIFAFDKTKRDVKRRGFGLDDAFVVGHVGRFNTPKNHPFIIDVFAQYKKTEPKAKLLLVGNHDGNSEIPEKIKLYGLTDDVILAGVRTDIGDCLSAMDVFLFPSLFEGFPVSLVEAQTSGLKCLVSDTITDEAFLTELVTPLPLGDGPEKWAQKLASLLPYERFSRADEITGCGYDITENAQKLADEYISLNT